MFKFLLLSFFVVTLYSNVAKWNQIEVIAPLKYSLEDWGLNQKEQGTYDSANVNHVAKIIQKKMFSLGYIFSEVSVYLDSVNRNKLMLKITPHEGFKLGKFRFKNNLTKSFLLQRFSQLKIGSPFSFDKVEEGVLRLKQLNYFDDVTIIEYLKNSLSHILYPVVSVRERKQNKIAVSLGLSSSESQAFLGLFDLSLINIRGNARDLGIYLLFQKQKRKLNFFYKEPFIPFTSLGLQFEGEIILEDSTYRYQKFSVEFFQYFQFNYRYGFLLEFNLSSFNDSIRDKVIRDQSFLSGITFSACWLDYSFNPKKGLGLKLELKTGHNTTNQGKIFLLEEKTEFFFWIPLFNKKWVYYQKIKSQGRWPFQNQRSFLHELGGAGSLRGHRQDQFLALWSLLSNLEWRWHFQEQNRLFFFYDVTWIYNNVLNEYIYGYGFGFLFQKKQFSLEVSFGLSNDHSISNGLLGLIIENHF